MKKIIAIIFMVFIASFGVTNAEDYVYEPTVLTFTGNTHSNPYTDVIFWTVFTGPNSEELVLLGFWDGGTTWKIRFTPISAGTWTYTTGALGDSLLSGKTGQITALESTSKGFIIRDPNNDFAFKRSRGNNIFLMGDTCWNCLSSQGMSTLEKFTDYLDVRKAQGFDSMIMHVAPLYESNRCRQTHPYCDYSKNDGGYVFGNPWNVDRINPLYFAELETRIAYANSIGITPLLFLGGDNQSLTTMLPTDAQLKRYLNYVVARLAAYDVMWSLRMEIEEQGTHAQDIAHAQFLGTTVRAADPYYHLISIHTTLTCGDEVGNEPWLDWVMHQGLTWAQVASDRVTYGKPVINAEFYYEDPFDSIPSWSSAIADMDTLRKGAWHLMMEGASGIYYGHIETLDGSPYPYNDISYATSTGQGYMTHLYNFMSGVDYWKFTPDPGNDLLINPGVQYIAYFEQGGSRTISVSPGCYIYNWYNPRAGTTEAGGSFSGSSYTFVPPDNNDWVLACVNDADACELINPDADGDGVPNDVDNCPEHYNPWQIDTYPPQGNGIGNACDCEGDFNCDGNVAADDANAFLTDFGRNLWNNPCTKLIPCKGDLNCDQNVAADDLNKFLQDFGRNLWSKPCPQCVSGNWCY
jgi:hypothetical protein